MVTRWYLFLPCETDSTLKNQPIEYKLKNLEKEEWRGYTDGQQHISQGNAGLNHSETSPEYIRTAKIKHGENVSCWQGCNEAGALLCCWWECKFTQPLQKIVWHFLIKSNVQLPYNPAIAFILEKWRFMFT